jgi:5'-methylthioadenosine phosphorylase
MSEPRAQIAIVGGSGLYALAGMEQAEDVAVDTPFGSPSDLVRIGICAGRRVAFLARHGRDHVLLPSEINYRANIFALKKLGVERIVAVSAVGSMAEEIHPRDIVLVDQFVDRTRGRISTFFGDGIVAHVSLAEPVCPEIRRVLREAADGKVHDGGTYLCIEGPAFSTRAESRIHRSHDVDVIGMTNLPEAKLAREAEICYATLALVTDYDCWHEEEEDVSVEGLLANLQANSTRAAEILREAIGRIPDRGSACRCGEALQDAVLTPPEKIGSVVRERLEPILRRLLSRR